MGPNNDMADVSAVVRQKIAAGIPYREAHEDVGRQGDGQACDLPVTSAGIEYEADLPMGRTLRFHQQPPVWSSPPAHSMLPPLPDGDARTQSSSQPALGLLTP
jgi:hypothetical protein